LLESITLQQWPVAATIPIAAGGQQQQCRGQ
jgi:hypothetical protein